MTPEYQTVRNPEVDILDSLEENGLLEITELDVRVRGEVAFIEGAVPNLKQKWLAGEVAARVKGIRDVVNMLRITPLLVIDDESLKKHIRRVLTRNSKIDMSNISVEVANSVVHLNGSVGTVAEKRLTEQEVWAIAGVRDIINKIEVLSAIPKSEMQVIGDILQSLSECLGIDLSKISVEIKEGVAYLRGVVPTDYLKNAAEELATWTPWVNGVVNNLEVLELPGARRHASPRVVRSPVEDCSHDTQLDDSRLVTGSSSTMGSITKE